MVDTVTTRHHKTNKKKEIEEANRNVRSKKSAVSIFFGAVEACVKSQVGGGDSFPKFPKTNGTEKLLSFTLQSKVSIGLQIILVNKTVY